MSQLLPAALLALALISPTYAIEPYEAICTSELDFETEAFVEESYCYGTNATACTDAGGKYNKDEAECYDINTDTPDECNEIAEFTYSPGQTCEEFVNLSDTSLFEYLNCSSPIIAYIVLPEIQSTCCGGMNNHKDICGSPPVHEAICTSEQDFQTNATGFNACEGNNSTACETAGGKYDENELTCEGIGIANPAECDQITGFNSEPRETCGEIGLFLYAIMSDNSSNVCADPAILTVLPQVQSNCCGGVNNHKDVCTSAPTSAPVLAPTSAPVSAPTGEKSSASDISNVLAVMIPTALLLCWTHL